MVDTVSMPSVSVISTDNKNIPCEVDNGSGKRMLDSQTGALKAFGKRSETTYDGTQSEHSFNKHRGTLYLRVGPMFCGKTTWLDGELTKLSDIGFKVLKITHSDDVRTDVASCDDTGSTHNSSYMSLSKKIGRVRASHLSHVDVSRYHVIGVDESQFFPDLLEEVEKWVEILGKHVRVVGLDGDSFKRKFGQTLDLIPISDEVIKLSARCNTCLKELSGSGFHGNILAIVGPFTKRLDGSTVQKDVGGSEKYIPVCRFHHSM